MKITEEQILKLFIILNDSLANNSTHWTYCHSTRRQLFDEIVG